MAFTRRVYFVFLCFLAILCLFSCDVKTKEEDENCGTPGLIYEDTQGGLSVCGYEGEDNAIIIPDTYGGKSVVAIGDSAFAGLGDITSVVIPDSVKAIGNGAFYQCFKLEKVKMGAGVVEIGSSAFSYCIGLESIVIPVSVTEIDNMAFFGCSELTIFCQAEKKPTQWVDNWNILDNKSAFCDVFWDCDRLVLEPSKTGVLSGEVYLDDTQEYIFYFADRDGVLEGYAELGRCSDGCFELDGVVIPPFALSLQAYVGDRLVYTLGIPKELILDGDPFVFGVLSDIHYNRYYHNGIDDDAEVSFDLALDYFESIGVEFVGIAGDITTNGEADAFVSYNEDIKDRPFKVYTITGNHDVYALEDGLWQEQITSKLTDVELAPNGLDFAYKIDKMGGDVFVFLNQVRWEYNTEESTILDIEQLIWLGGVLEENKDVTVYLFFHTFLCGPDGEKHTGVGNILNPGGYTYPLPYTFGQSDEAEFRRLMKKYKNVVYFSGHSHWMFEMDVYGENTNFFDFDGEYCQMVHVPSVTEPRYIGEMDVNRTGKNGESSQGWVVYDYGETAVYVPVDFISGVVYTDRIRQGEQVALE